MYNLEVAKLITKNKKATFDNEILEKYSAGIILTGQEVKSAKNGGISLDGAYVFVNPTGAILRNAIIQPWEHANSISLTGYDKARDRGLLLTKKQLLHLYTRRKELKAQVVPIAVVVDHNLLKIEIGLARGLKKYDKKNRRKEREEKRNVQIAKRADDIRDIKD